MGKYKGLKEIYKYWIDIPYTIYINSKDLQLNDLNYFLKLIKNCELKFPIIIRSSYIDEYYNMTPGRFSSFIANNYLEYIKYLNFIKKKYKIYIDLWKYSIILQPLVKGDISWVIYKSFNDIYIEYILDNYNFWVTWLYDSNNVIKKIYYNLLKDSYYVSSDMKYILPILNKLKLVPYDNFFIEFSFLKSKFYALQFNPLNKKIFSFNDFYDYVNIFKGILELMKRLWYLENEYFIIENDTFLFFHELWERKRINEKIEHIFINLLENKFIKYYFVRNWKTYDIFPDDSYSKREIELFSKKYWVNLIFTTMFNNYSGLKIKTKIYKYKNNLFRMKFLYEPDHLNHFNKKELKFFVDRLLQFWASNLGNIYNTYMFKLINLLKIYKLDNSNNIKKSIYYVRQALNIIRLIYKKWIRKKSNIISWVILWRKSWLDEYIIYKWDIHNIKYFINNKNKKIAFYCDDFEPSWEWYLKYIDLVITLRWNILSHGIQVCKRKNKDIIYNFYIWHDLNLWDTIEVNFDKWTIKLI